MTLCQSTGAIASHRDCLENSQTPVSSSFTETPVSDCFPMEKDNLSSACEGQQQGSGDNINDEFNKINDEKLNDKNTDIQDGLPVDHGWAWVIMIGKLLSQRCLFEYNKRFLS